MGGASANDPHHDPTYLHDWHMIFLRESQKVPTRRKWAFFDRFSHFWTVSFFKSPVQKTQNRPGSLCFEQN